MSAGNENTGFAVVLFSHVRESESNWRAKQLQQSLRTSSASIYARPLDAVKILWEKQSAFIDIMSLQLY
jgi:hypothetical protein